MSPDTGFLIHLGLISQLYLISKIVMIVSPMKHDYFDLLLSYKGRHTYQCRIEQRLMTEGPIQALNLQMRTCGQKEAEIATQAAKVPTLLPHMEILMSHLCAQNHTSPPTLQGWETDPVSCPCHSPTHYSLPGSLSCVPRPLLLARVLGQPCSLGMVVVLFVGVSGLGPVTPCSQS